MRVDILEPNPCGGWHAIEVKASSRVRRYQLADVSTQVWVMRGCGIEIGRATIRHLARPVSWRQSDIAAIRFADADVTAAIAPLLDERPVVAARAGESVRGSTPQRDPGPHCQRPFACEFQMHCQAAARLPLLQDC